MEKLLIRTIKVFMDLKKINHWYPEVYYDMAIETMRKYQKIEQIVDNWNDMNSWDSMCEIKKVVEDGKN